MSSSSFLFSVLTFGSCCHSNPWREQSPHLSIVFEVKHLPPLSLSQLQLYRYTLTSFHFFSLLVLLLSHSFSAGQNRWPFEIVAMFPLSTFCSCLNQFLSCPIISLLLFLFTSLPSDSNYPPIAQCVFLSIFHSLPISRSITHCLRLKPSLALLFLFTRLSFICLLLCNFYLDARPLRPHVYYRSTTVWFIVQLALNSFSRSLCQMLFVLCAAPYPSVHQIAGQTTLDRPSATHWSETLECSVP